MGLICLILVARYLISQILVYTDQPTTNSTLSWKQTNIYMIKFARICPVVPLLFLLEKYVSNIYSKLRKHFQINCGYRRRQLYPFSMCQEMPSDFNTRWEFDSDSQKFKTMQNRLRKYEHKVISYLKSQRLNCTIESYCKTATQKK